MIRSQNKKRAVAASTHALGFLLGLMPGLIVWYIHHDRNLWLSRHGLAAARFQAIMLFIDIGLLSLYDRCRITNNEIALFLKGSTIPFVQRPEAMIIAILCALVFVAAWFTNLALSICSTVAATRGRDATYPLHITGARP